MLAALAALLLGTAASLGLGIGAARIALDGHLRGVTVGDAGLLGLAVLAVLGTLVNMVAPVAPWPATAVVLLGLGLLAANIGRLRAISVDWGGTPFATVLLLATFFVAFLPAILRSPAWHYDTGLYHLQDVRLVMEHPVVLGAASIHERFGYNTLWFPLAAMLAGGMPGVVGAFVVNALLAAFVLLALADRVPAAIRRGHGRTAVFGALFALLVYAMPGFPLAGWIGSPNTDVPAALLVLYAVQLAFALSDADDAERYGTASLLVACVALAVAAKLSALPLVGLAILPLLDWRQGRLGGRQVGVLAAVALAIGVPWLVRGLATSGCLAYPQPSSCIALPWTVHADVARVDMAWVQAWARLPGVAPEVVLADRSWMRPWVAALLADPVRWQLLALLALTLGCAAAALTCPRLPSTWAGLDARRRFDSLVILGTALAALAFWFTSAPLLRYGKAFIILPPMVAVALLAPAATVARLGRALPGAVTRGRVVAVLLAAAVIVVAARPGRLTASGAFGFPVLPVVETRPLGDFGGLAIHQPINGEQCWDAPRICTPRLHRDLIVSRHGPWWVVRNRSE